MAFNTTKNYYEILGVQTDSTFEEIKSAYRHLARKYHPDVNKETDAIKLFKEITNAYETLSDSTKRNQYDIINGIFKPDTKEQKTTSAQAEKEYKQTQKKNFSDEFTSANKDLKKEKRSKKFEPIKTLKFWFKKIQKVRKHKDKNKPKKGDDITTDIVISPDESYTGSKRIINIRTTKTCPQCLGHKFANGNKCPKCNGSGTVTETKKITVTIPKGIKNGSKLRLKGEGAAGKNGGANGDLYINVKIEARTPIHYDKLNVYYNVPITPFEAALGEEISIPVFDGKIKLKLPKNTCSGQKFRIAKQGIKKNGKIGDLIVTVSIEFSHDLSEDEIKLYKELKNLSKNDVRKNFGYGS